MKLISKEKLNNLLLIGLIISIFFPIRHVFNTPTAQILGYYSDFTSFSLYLADIFAISLVLFNVRLIIKTPLSRLCAFLGLLILLAISIYSHQTSIPLSLYYFLRIIEVFAIYRIISESKVNIKSIKNALITLGILQTGIGIAQFWKQQSIGLRLLGESKIGIEVPNVAKIVSEGLTYLRAYGTFPHSNILSAFLFTSLLFSLQSLFDSEKSRDRLIYITTTIVLIMGLLITFSRAGILTAIIACGIFFIYKLYINSNTWKRTISYMIILLTASTCFILILKPLFFTRITITDQAVVERRIYNQIGIKIISSNPILGVGIGTSLLHMQHYSSYNFKKGELQPIHNYYLLVAADSGIPMALLFIYLLLWHIVKIARTLKESVSMFHVTLLLLLISYGLLMMFDHYFYTIVPAQILLWLILGFTMREIKKPAV